jgi:hypothetical protein
VAHGLDSGIWFAVRTGVRALVAPDERGQLRMYVVCEPVGRYYEVMTKSTWMPYLVGQEL